MDLKQKQKIVNKISSGKVRCRINGVLYIVNPPSLELKLYLDELHDEILYENSYNGWLTENQCHAILMRKGLLPFNFNNSIKELESSIEDLKVDLYKNSINPKSSKKIREILEETTKKYYNILSTKESLSYTTAKGFADIRIKQCEIYHCLTYENGKQVNMELVENDFMLLNEILQHVVDSNISTSEYREIARSEPWRSLWSVGKPNPFLVPAVLLTEQQKTLVSLSKMYDSVFEHPECPDDEIIDDDDMLDGWIINQRRQGEKQKMENKVDKLLTGKFANKDEIYIAASSKEEASKIDEFNDLEAKITKKRREKLINQHGTVKETDMPDVKEKYRRQVAQARSAAAKKMR